MWILMSSCLQSGRHDASSQRGMIPPVREAPCLQSGRHHASSQGGTMPPVREASCLQSGKHHASSQRGIMPPVKEASYLQLERHHVLERHHASNQMHRLYLLGGSEDSTEASNFRKIFEKTSFYTTSIVMYVVSRYVVLRT